MIENEQESISYEEFHVLGLVYVGQCCDDTKKTGLTENNAVIAKWVATPF